MTPQEQALADLKDPQKTGSIYDVIKIAANEADLDPNKLSGREHRALLVNIIDKMQAYVLSLIPATEQPPVNQVPVAGTAIPNQTLDINGAPVYVSLSDRFTDADADPLVYTATTSNAQVVTVQVGNLVGGVFTADLNGTYLRLTPLGVSGTSAVAVTVSDGNGGSATMQFNVTTQIILAPTESGPEGYVYFQGGLAGIKIRYVYYAVGTQTLPNDMNFSIGGTASGSIVYAQGMAGRTVEIEAANGTKYQTTFQPNVNL